MTREPIAWCGEPLRLHSVAVARVAWTLYQRDWTVVSKRTGVPGWSLALAALAHDAGKAMPCIASRAAGDCYRGRSPSFRLHEYASAYLLAVLADEADAVLGEEEARGVRAAGIAALMHHHGMRDRLEPVASVGGKRPGREGCRTLREEVPRSLGAMADVLLEAARSLQAANTPEAPPDDLIEIAGSLRYYDFERALKDLIRHGDRRVLFAGYALTGYISVADTIVSSWSRSGSIGGYVLRILRERGCKDHTKLLDELQSIYEGWEAAMINACQPPQL